MAHVALLARSRIRPESVGRDVARLLAPAYAGLLADDLPDAFASILGRMDSGRDDIASRLLDLACREPRGDTDPDLTWASYERRPDASRFVDPRWRMRARIPVQH